MKDPRMRFSNRAKDYARNRPGYPPEILSFLADACGLAEGSVVADIGSGTGLLGRIFLADGYRVLAVEPNNEMREAAESILGGHPRFTSVAGSAEATTLTDDSVDLVAAGNSFNWAEPDSARVEFSRILKPGGLVAIVWNVPRESGTPFIESFRELLSGHRADDGGRRYSEDIYERTEALLGAGGYERDSFPHSQPLDFESLKGLVQSYSSMPAEGGPGSAEMLHELEGIFRANESGGRVAMEYVAHVYCGTLG